mmetsp:Transcript_43850/g.103699  ORF Transcript_43850/g.103699 Transcript_43850/m.103699 type:complete len:268 (+) Transcript_43850:99-902(+)
MGEQHSGGSLEQVSIDDLISLVVRTALCTAVFAGLHLAFRPVVRLTNMPTKSYGDWVNRVVAVFHAVVSSALGVMMLLMEPPFSEIAADVAAFRPVDTVHATSPRLWYALPFTLGYFVYDCCMMLIDPEVCMALMVVHHVVSLTIWPISFLTSAGTFYIAYFLFTEVSTPFLHFAVFFLPKHGIETGVRTLMGWGLLLSFFLARVLPVPMLYYSLYASQPYWADIHPTVRRLAMCTLPLPPLLFVHWFARIVHGSVKHLTSDKSKTS